MSTNFSNILNTESISTFKILERRIKFQVKKIVSALLNQRSENFKQVDYNKLNKLISHDDFIAYIIENNIRTLNLNKLTKENKNKILKIIYRNHPLYQINKLKKFDKIVILEFSGIKHLNDKLGQNFVNNLIKHFKNIIINNLNQFQIEHCIFVDSYKQLGITSQNIDTIESIFIKQKTKNEVINNYVKTLDNEYFKDLSYTKSEVIDLINTYFHFGIDKGTIKSNNDIIEKLNTIRIINAGAKINIDNSNIVFENHSKNKEMILDDKIKTLKNKIIQEYNKNNIKYFYINLLKYPIFNKKDGKIYFSKKLIKEIKKNEDLVYPKKLRKNLKEYINLLNKSYDFIPPISGGITKNNQYFFKINKLSQKVENGYIPTKYILKDYKGGDTPEVFKYYNEKYNGVIVHMDGQDIGTKNLKLFDKTNEQKNSVIGIYNSKKKLNVHYEVTKEIMSTRDKINKILHPISKQYGGDENNILIKNKFSQENLIKALNYTSGNYKGRFIIIGNNHNLNNPLILDKVGQILKGFERKYKKIDETKYTKNYFLTMENSIEEKIFDCDSSCHKKIEKLGLAIVNNFGKIIKNKIGIDLNFNNLKLSITENENHIILHLHK